MVLRAAPKPDYRQNPFQTLYLTEALEDPELFAKLFSPLIVRGEAERLFRIGNVVLLGTNGTGKTMLLRLFAPQVCATILSQPTPWPTSPTLFRFFSVGVNLVHAGFGSLGGRRLSEDPDENLVRWQYLFGDLLNYYLVGELLVALEDLISGRPVALHQLLGGNVSPKQLEAFAAWYAQRDCWFGAHRDCRTLTQLRSQVQARVLAYKKFINWNTKTIDDDIDATKTQPGSVLAEAATGLREMGILGADVPFTVTIDQYETLAHIDYESAPTPDLSIGRALCRVVNSLLAARDPKVSYKIGARPYSWHYERRSLGTDGKLEYARDYQIVDLDEVLRRQENSGSWTFRDFAADVAARRIGAAFRGQPADYKSWLPERLDELSPNEELARYCGKDPERLLPTNPAWSSQWNQLLRDIYHRDRYEARLAEAWTYQTLGRGERLPDPSVARQRRPWDRQWWRKERREPLMAQSASAARQRRLYGGWDTLLTLSGSNILIFLNLCREIWDIWDRSRAGGADLPGNISAEIQSHAIRIVSEAWLEKQTEFPGGSQRRDFVLRLGIAIRRALLEDKGLSYPGHNGFSLLIEDYESRDAADVKAFLANASDFGALLASPHTTKERDRRPRRKWYPFPILCPHFEIPATRTKEPFYTDVETIRAWITRHGYQMELRPSSRREGVTNRRHQRLLFGDDDPS